MKLSKQRLNHLNSVDRVLLESVDLVQSILEQARNHKEEVMSQEPPLTEGILEYSFQDKEDELLYFRNISKGRVLYEIIVKDEKQSKFIYTKSTRELTDVTLYMEGIHKIDTLDEKTKSAIYQLLLVHLSILWYIATKSGRTDRVETTQEIIKRRDHKGEVKHPKKGKRRVNLRANVVRVYKAPQGQTDSFKSHCDSWGVRGHWRRYRDDEGMVIKKVWIGPYIKGEGGSKRGKEYTL